ncbi:MAG: alkaline phosphatase family protein, partial [Rubrivivax sp.]
MILHGRLAALAVAAAAAALAAAVPAAWAQPAASGTSSPPPRLVVLLVIDGLPQRRVTEFRDQFAPDGLRRFLDRGTWYAQAHYGHALTATAPGHAVMLTGAHPQRTGIVANEWIDPATRAPVYNTQDARCAYIGHKTEALSGTSPRMLLSETVGDVLRTAHPASKVIAISGKDRGAILPAGHRGTAYMYMSGTGQFATSTFYLPEHPKWVEAFHAGKPADAFFGKTWAPLLEESAYARSVPDGQSWQSNSGNGNRLPAVVGARMDGPGPMFYGNLLASPFGDELTLAFARAAIEGEGLGQDDKPDILSVSLSSHDYVNHAFGPESRLSHDHLLHLDRQLQGFFRYLDARVGSDRYMAVLTADHGFADTPEWAASQGRDSRRVSSSQLLAQVNAELAQGFGAGRWITHFTALGLLFDEALIRERGLEPDKVYAAARASLLRHPDVQAAFTREQLRGTQPAAEPFLEQARKTWHPERSPPLLLVLKHGRFFGSRPVGSTHGSPHPYDTHVPIMLWGPAWVGRGEMREPVEVADIAPTLARVLGVAVPKDAQGRVLPRP